MRFGLLRPTLAYIAGVVGIVAGGMLAGAVIGILKILIPILLAAMAYALSIFHTEDDQKCMEADYGIGGAIAGIAAAIYEGASAGIAAILTTLYPLLISPYTRGDLSKCLH